MMKYVHIITYGVVGDYIGAYLNIRNAEDFVASKPKYQQFDYTIHSIPLSDFLTEEKQNIVNLVEIADQFSGAILFDGESGVSILKTDGFFYFDGAFTPFNDGRRIKVTEVESLNAEALSKFELTADNLNKETRISEVVNTLSKMTEEERDSIVTRFGYLLP